MKELSLNILDIVENSCKAEATLVKIIILEDDERLTVSIEDNGMGMTNETLLSVTNPFYTTRTTRKVGMGIPLFKLAAEQTGGSIKITSNHISDKTKEHGTTLTALFYKNHIDFTPLGNVIDTLITLIQGHPTIDFLYMHSNGESTVTLETAKLRAVLEDVPLNSFEILAWIRENLEEQYNEKHKNNIEIKERKKT